MHTPNPRRLSHLLVVLIIAITTLSCAFVDSLVRGRQPGVVDVPEEPAPSTAEIVMPAPTTPVEDGLIAYLGLDGNIYTTDREGSQPRAVTDDANLERLDENQVRLYQSPTWAPDGKHLAILKFSGGAGERVTASLLIAQDGMSETLVAYTSQEHFPFYMSWSPDSRFVTLLSNTRGGVSLSLHLVDAESGVNRILHTGQPFYWDWSPDGQQILVHTGGSTSQNRNAELGLLDPDTEQEINVFDLKPSSFQSPAWSPSGAGVILAVETEAGGESLVLASVDGNVQRTLEDIDGPVAFAWSPPGEHVAYSVQDASSSQDVVRTLKLISPYRDAPAESLVAGPLLAWFWSPDGQRIAYFMLVNAIGKGADRLAQTLAPSRMGLYVIDINSGENQQLALFRPTQSFLEVIPFFDQYQRSSTIWSPDSRSLVIAALDPNDAEGIYVVAADGSQAPEKIAEGVIGFWSR